jgi:hypothetical protein
MQINISLNPKEFEILHASISKKITGTSDFLSLRQKVFEAKKNYDWYIKYKEQKRLQ